MEQIQLNAQLRQEKGKKVKKIRNNGLIPAVIYSKGNPSMNLMLNKKDFIHLIKGISENTIFDLNVDGKEKKIAIIKDVQYDPINEEILHIDFHQISLQEEIEVEIPVVLIGQAKGVTSGGIVNQLLRGIKIKCLPTKIPENFKVDISNLDIGESLHLNDLKIEEKILTFGNPTIVSIVPPEKEEIKAATPEEKKAETPVKEEKTESKSAEKISEKSEKK